MLPQKLNHREIPERPPANRLKYNIRPEVSFHNSSICSTCESVDCFKTRNHNSMLSCTCANCKDTKTSALSQKILVNKETNDKSFYKISNQNTMEHHNIQTKSGKSKVELGESTKCSYNDITLITNETEKRDTIEKSYTRNFSVAVSYDRNGEKLRNENPTTTLSAQVMNLPFQEFKDSLSSHISSTSFGSHKLIKPDILTKLKEIYKAGSCKVCECIIGKPCYPNNDTFNDETCDCGYTNNHNIQFGFKKVPHSGCPCISCDRKDCRGIVKKKTIDLATCDCRPCECVKFTESLTKSCDCEPCQCTECSHLNYRVPQSVIVAPVQGNFQQNLCQCSPCECAECTHNYGTMASSLMREISTGMVTQRNCDCETCLNRSCQLDGADCRCDTQNRIMRKPIERDNRVYDLHQALIGENSFDQKQYTKTKNYDTIAMYALSSNYSNSVFNKTKEHCICKECECIICKDSDKHGPRIIYEDSYKSPNLSNNSINVCKCQPCECQVCCRDKFAQNIPLNDITGPKQCGCDICDCIICKGLPYCSQNSKIVEVSKINLKYKSSVHQFEDSNGTNEKVSRETFYPLKKGELLTPSMFEAKMLPRSPIKSQSQSCLSVLKKPCKSIYKVNGQKSSGKLLAPKNISINHNKLSNKYFYSGNHQSSCQNISALLSRLQNDSCIKTIPRTCESSIAYTYDTKSNVLISKTRSCNLLDNIILNSNNATSARNLRIDNENGKTNLIYSDKSISTCFDKVSQDKPMYTGERYKNQIRKSKKKIHDNGDLFNDKIASFEKSISQLKEDISQHLKTLSEIRSKDKIFNDNIFDINICDSFITKKSLTSIHNINMSESAKPIKFVDFYEEPDKIFNSINEKMEEIEDTEKQCDGVNFTNCNKKMYTKLIRRTQVNKRKKGVRSKAELIKQSENKINNFINEHSKNKLEIELSTKSTCTSFENCSVARILNVKNETVIDQSDENNHWSILKKGLYLNNPLVRKNKGVCTIPELEMDIKRIVQSISLQTPETTGYKALTRLHLEVNDLLNSPMLQSWYEVPKYHVMDDQYIFKPKSKIDLELKCISSDATSQTPRLPLTVEKEVNCNMGQSMEVLNRNMSLLLDAILTRTIYKSELTRTYSAQQEDRISKIVSVKSSCDGLKASFMGLRKVSNHTVLVKWKMPREVAEVQGYELQVDGRAVQKILNPTRCMAVLTCLPHCDKLLLTIRTLTTAVVPIGHYPAATIVYCPRQKHSRYSRPIYI